MSLGSVQCVNPGTTRLTPSLPSELDASACKVSSECWRKSSLIKRASPGIKSGSRNMLVPTWQQEAGLLNKPWLPAQGRVLGTGGPSPVLLAPMQHLGHTGTKNLLLFILNSNLTGRPVSYPVPLVRGHLPASSRRKIQGQKW